MYSVSESKPPEITALQVKVMITIFVFFMFLNGLFLAKDPMPPSGGSFERSTNSSVLPVRMHSSIFHLLSKKCWSVSYKIQRGKQIMNNASQQLRKVKTRKRV